MISSSTLLASASSTLDAAPSVDAVAVLKPTWTELAHGLFGPELAKASIVDIDKSYLVMLVLFIVFAVVLHYLVLKPLIASQDARYRGMGGAREDASSFELRAAELRLNYERRLTAARQEAVAIRETLKKEAQGQAQAQISATNQAAETEVAAALANIQTQGKTAREQMPAHAEALAETLSSKLVGGN